MVSGYILKFLRGNICSMASLFKNSNMTYNSLAQENRQKSFQAYDKYKNNENHGQIKRDNYRKCLKNISSKFSIESSNYSTKHQIRNVNQNYSYINLNNNYDVKSSGMNNLLKERVRRAHEIKNYHAHNKNITRQLLAVLQEERIRLKKREERKDSFKNYKFNYNSMGERFEKKLATELIKKQKIENINTRKRCAIDGENYLPNLKREFYLFRSPSSCNSKKSIREYLMPFNDDVKRSIAIPQIEKPKRVFFPKYNWNKPPPKSALDLKLSLDRELEMASRTNIEMSTNCPSSSLRRRSFKTNTANTRTSPTQTLARHINFNLLPQNDRPLASRYHHISYMRSHHNM